MPSKSDKQARLMRAVAHGWEPDRVEGPTKKVAREFVKADKNKQKGGAARKRRPSRPAVEELRRIRKEMDAPANKDMLMIRELGGGPRTKEGGLNRLKMLLDAREGLKRASPSPIEGEELERLRDIISRSR